MNRVNLIGFISDEPKVHPVGGHSWVVLKTVDKLGNKTTDTHHRVLVPAKLVERFRKEQPICGRTFFVEGKLQQESSAKSYVFAQVAYLLPEEKK